MTEKECSKCNEIKPLGEFHIDRRMPLGRASSCKQCRNQQKREYYEENRDAVLERRWEYVDKNREVILERQRKYREENCRAVSEYNRKYREENREAIRERQRGYSATRFKGWGDIKSHQIERVRSILSRATKRQAERLALAILHSDDYEWQKFRRSSEGDYILADILDG